MPLRLHSTSLPHRQVPRQGASNLQSLMCQRRRTFSFSITNISPVSISSLTTTESIETNQSPFFNSFPSHSQATEYQRPYFCYQMQISVAVRSDSLESVLVTRYLSLATKLSDLPHSFESAFVTVFSLACHQTVQVTSPSPLPICPVSRLSLMSRPDSLESVLVTRFYLVCY